MSATIPFSLHNRSCNVSTVNTRYRSMDKVWTKIRLIISFGVALISTAPRKKRLGSLLLVCTFFFFSFFISRMHKRPGRGSFSLDDLFRCSPPPPPHRFREPVRCFSRGGYVKHNSWTLYTVQWLFHARLVSIESRSVRHFFLRTRAHRAPGIIMIQHRVFTRINPLPPSPLGAPLSGIRTEFLFAPCFVVPLRSSLVHVNICRLSRSFVRENYSGDANICSVIFLSVVVAR